MKIYLKNLNYAYDFRKSKKTNVMDPYDGSIIELQPELKKRNIVIYNSAKIGNNVYIGENVVIERLTAIGDNVVIENNVRICEGAKIDKNTYISQNACIFYYAKIKEGSFVGRHSLIK